MFSEKISCRKDTDGFAELGFLDGKDARRVLKVGGM